MIEIMMSPMETTPDVATKNKIPPHDLKAEQLMLGTILLSGRSVRDVFSILEPSNFYQPAHKLIFEALLQLFEKNEPHNLIAVTNFLQNNNKLDEAGGLPYLTMLASIAPLGFSRLNAEQIHQKSILRHLIEIFTNIVTQCYDEQVNIDILVNEAEQAIRKATCPKSSNLEFTSMYQAVVAAFKAIEKLYEQNEKITGASTGFIELDRMTTGLQPSDLIILAACPSMSRTALAMSIAQHMALVDDVGVGIFSLELPRAQLIMRLFSSVGRIDTQRICTGRLLPSDWPKLTRAVGYLAEAPLYIDDTPDISIQEIRAKLNRLAAQHNIGLIIVDYLQLIRGQTACENRSQELREILQDLKTIAEEFKIPVLVLSQLNRNLECRPDKRPLIADVPDSEVIEEEADIICFIYHDEVYNQAEDNLEKCLAEIIIEKNKNGPTGSFKLAFLKEYALFDNVSD